MIVTQKDARRLITASYPGLLVRLTVRCSIAARPKFEMVLGLPTLAWCKLQKGKSSAVRLGRVLAGGQIDWTWSCEANKPSDVSKREVSP